MAILFWIQIVCLLAFFFLSKYSVHCFFYNFLTNSADNAGQWHESIVEWFFFVSIFVSRRFICPLSYILSHTGVLTTKCYLEKRARPMTVFWNVSWNNKILFEAFSDSLKPELPELFHLVFSSLSYFHYGCWHQRTLVEDNTQLCEKVHLPAANSTLLLLQARNIKNK